MQIKYYHDKNKDGFGLIEVFVGVSILVLIYVGLTTALRTSIVVADVALERLQSAYLLEEGVEAIKLLRAESWDNNIAVLNHDTPYYLVFNGSSWYTTLSPALINDKYDRKLFFREVMRDGNDDIASTGTTDAGTLLLDIDISWVSRGQIASSTLNTYITAL